MADRLLNVGRPFDSAADGEEEGDGATTSGVVAGEAGATGVDCGVAVVVASGVAWACGVGVAADVASGDGVVAGVAAGDAVGAGDGELAGCPPEGAVGCCSHPTRTLAKATATTRRLFMPNNTDA